jgi:peroxiredoxin
LNPLRVARILRRVPSLLAAALPALLAAAFSLGCSDRSSGKPPGDAASAAPSAAAAPSPQPAAAKSEEPPRRALPAFEGRTLDGAPVAVRELLGRRFVLFFFNPEVKEAATAARAVAGVTPFMQSHNFSVVGIAQGSSPGKARAFLSEHHLDGLRVLEDAGGTIAQKLGLRAPVALVGVDAEGYLAFGWAQFGTEPGAHELFDEQLRKELRLPRPAAAVAPEPGRTVAAPDFSAQRLEGDEPFSLASLRGKPVVLVFFLHTCPHCHHALAFFREYLKTLPADKRPEIVGISMSNRTSGVKEKLQETGLDYFPVLVDFDRKVAEAYGATGGVPDIFLIDAEGRVTGRVSGWRDDLDPPLMKMRVAKLAGAPVPMLLHQTGFSGSEACAVCHESEHATWELTNHATAFQTLVEHGSERDPECVSCHVVGYEKRGGYTVFPATPHLEDVGCETCHGRGGPHLSPGHVVGHDYSAVCATCHDPKHSLGFEYASFLPRVSHAAQAGLLNLGPEERAKLLAERGRPRKDLIKSQAAFVGSQACQSCHASEWETWSKSPHARAGKTLTDRGKGGDIACLTCHTTALGKPGGFAADRGLGAQPDTANVGCESCHGPGGDHVAENARRIGSIVSLGDKCDSCVILQICGGCHDDANDPGFEFEVKQKIEAQRHGTIEAGTGRPLGGRQAAQAQDAAAPDTPAGLAERLVERAFAPAAAGS